MFAKLKWWLAKKLDRCPEHGWRKCGCWECWWYDACQSPRIVSKPKYRRIPVKRVRRVPRKPFVIEED